MTHVHFDRIFFKIVPSFESHTQGGQTGNPQTVLHQGTDHHPDGGHHQGQGIQGGVKPLEMKIPLTVTPPLRMIERVQGI